MFTNFFIIINNIIDYFKLLFDDNYSFNIFKDMFNKIYDERCKNIVGDSQPDVLPAVENIYVISDIHGDYEKLIKLLEKSNVIEIIKNNNNNNNNIHIITKDNIKIIQDNNNIIKWIGKDSIIVQVGDQIDRCRGENNCADEINDDKNDDWKILKFMTLLNEIAMSYNGKVYSLLGNHEIMNTTHNFFYVSKKGIDEFSKNYDKNYLYKFNNNNNNNNNNNISREEAFKVGNEIANFLACTRKLCIVIGTHVFVHGNISSKIAYKYKVSDMNKIVSLYLFDTLKTSDLRENKKLKNLADIAIYELLQSPKSPIWNRDLNELLLDDDNKTIPKWLINQLKCNDINFYLKNFISKSINHSIIPFKENTVIKVGNIIVGHTPQLETGGYIKSRCNNKVWLTDYAASIAFKKSKENKKNYPEIQILHIYKDTMYQIIS
jgi:hypothetical protein